MTEEALKQVVDKLIGPINPIADAAIDSKRLENLQILLSLMSKLMDDIGYVAESYNSLYGSQKYIGQVAEKWLKETSEWINETQHDK